MNDSTKAILRALAKGPRTIDEIADLLGIRRANVAGSVSSMNGQRLVCRAGGKPQKWVATVAGHRLVATWCHWTPPPEVAPEPLPLFAGCRS